MLKLLQEIGTTQVEQPPVKVTQAPGFSTSCSASALAPEISKHSTIELEARLKDHLVSMEKIKTDKFGAKRLDTICRSVGGWTPNRILEELTLYLLEAFPAKRPKERKAKESGKQESKISKRRARRIRNNPADVGEKPLKLLKNASQG